MGVGVWRVIGGQVAGSRNKAVSIRGSASEMDLKGEGSDRISRVLCFAVFFLIPFLGGNHLSLPRVTIDRFWIETSFLLLLIGAISIAFLKRTNTRSGYGAFLLYFMPLFFLSCLSLVYTWNTYNTIRELNLLIWILGVVYLWTSSTDKQFPLRALVWGTVAVVICAVVQLKVLFPYLSGIFKTGWYASILGEKPVPFAAFLNENMLGGYLLLVLPISVLLAIHEQKGRNLPAVPVLILGILLSLSRLSMIVMVLELLTMGIIFAVYRRHRYILKLIAATAVGVLLFFIVIHFQGSASEKRVEQSFKGKTSSALTQIRTLNLRTSIWQAAKEAFEERPVAGYGAGAFEYAYRKHFDGRLYTRYSHGGAAKMAVELGVIGLIASLWYLFGIVRGVRKEGLRNLFLVVAVTGGFLFALVDCALDTAAFVVTFFSISSFFLASARSEEQHSGRPYLVPLIALLVLSFAFTDRADLAKKTVEEGLLFEEMGNPSAAASSYGQASGLMPVNDESRTRRMSLILNVKTNDPGGDRQRICEAINENWNQISLKRNQDSELLFVNARANRRIGRPGLAYEQIFKAIELYPSSAYYVSHAMDWLVLDGRYETAKQLSRRFEPFVENIRTWGNPYGLYVYRLREIDSDIEFKMGDTERAIALGKRNLDSAKNDEFVITSYKAREYVKKEWLVKHLESKLSSYQSQAAHRRSE
jgi:O-antigen ligase